ncbi:MAG: lysylphosphatidylglycerol synthase domain-containing protein [Pirellula staleyi]
MNENPSSAPKPTNLVLPPVVDKSQSLQGSRAIGRLGESAKITAIIAIMCVAFWVVRNKLVKANVTWAVVQEGISNVPYWQIGIACLLTALNYLILTGYDWIAVRHLKKELPMTKIMTGAIVGYSYGNVLGWLLGGNAVRYRLYSSWGFSFLEIVAFVSILATTFWLGLFLLAGVAFIALPIKLPEEVSEKLIFDHHVWGILFLGCIGLYLAACTIFRKPIRVRDFEVTLPPFRLSTMQLVVSAGDFLLASLVLFWLLPSSQSAEINFSTVLIAYLTGQIITVLTHVPGGFGVLEGVLVSFFPEESLGDVLAAVVLFRIIYYFLPFIPATILVIYNEFRSKHRFIEAARDI